MKTIPSVIIGIGTAIPPFELSQENAERIMVANFKEELSPRSLDVLRKVMRHPSVVTRYICARTVEELLAIKNENPDSRIERFTSWAVDLSEKALQTALDKAGVTKNRLTALIVNTCTGYLCPGIATYLIERMKLNGSIPIYDLVGAGCAGAIPAMQLARKIVQSDPESIIASVSVEICSATFEMSNDIGLIVSNALFGDGAAAAIITGAHEGIAIEATSSLLLPEWREHIRYIYRGGRLHNKLDVQLPKIIGRSVPPFVRDLLSQKGLLMSDVRHWLFHPGGSHVLDALQSELMLTNDTMRLSRDILARYGNMSSPTVLFELEEQVRLGIEKNAWCAMVAFGAGLAIHGFLLRKT